MKSSRQAVPKVSHRHLLSRIRNAYVFPGPNYPVPFFLSLSHDISFQSGGSAIYRDSDRYLT